MIGSRSPLVVLAVAGVVLLAAGCGGAGKPASVASLPPSHSGTTTQSAPTQAAPGTSGSGSAAGGSQAEGLAIKTQDGARFSACMRSHGLPTFPDPNAQGVIQFGTGVGIDPSSPKFQAAQQACRKVLPNGGRPSPQQIAKAQHATLVFSACMRSHGIKDFPDPTFTGGGVTLKLRGGSGSDLAPSSPVFQKAQAACQSLPPGKIAGGPGS